MTARIMQQSLTGPQQMFPSPMKLFGAPRTIRNWMPEIANPPPPAVVPIQALMAWSVFGLFLMALRPDGSLAWHDPAASMFFLARFATRRHETLFTI